MYEGRSGANRLAFALHSAATDKQAMQAIAKALNYNPEQLEEDIQAYWNLSGDSITTAAAKGYAAAAAIGTGAGQLHTTEILQDMEAAMENMTEAEAEQLYNSKEWMPEP